jgi:polysaccharide export outer membrane protein
MKIVHFGILQFTAYFLSFTLVFVSVAPLFAATANDAAPASEAAVSGLPQSDYPPLLIGPGDLLTITVVGFDHHEGGLSAGMAMSNSTVDIPTDYIVDNDGKILFPFIGQVPLAGNSQIDASILIMKKLSQFIKFPQVTVLIKNSNSYNVAVLGQVDKPGKYLIRGRPTILSALSEAGGPGENANLGGSILIHNGKKTKIDLGKYLLNTNYDQESPYVYPGDVLMVPKSEWPSPTEWAIIASIISSAVVVYIEVK